MAARVREALCRQQCTVYQPWLALGLAYLTGFLWMGVLTLFGPCEAAVFQEQVTYK